MLISFQEKNKLAAIARKYSLDLVLLFGSRTAGNFNQKSDFDIAYLSRKDLTLEAEARLIIDLSPVLKSEEIDLVNLKKASSLLAFAVFKDCGVLYQKNSLLFSAQRVYAFKKYVEAKPLYQEKFRRLQERIKSL